MTYARYINREGKRRGPYYYKSIRDESGRVKSVYVGKGSEAGKRPLKTAIIVLFALLITVSALFFLQNRSAVLSKIAAEESMVPFEMDQVLIKVLIKSGEHLEKTIRVMNVGDKGKALSTEVLGLSDIVSIREKEFELKPGQTKIIALIFFSFDEKTGIEKSPGVYVGKILAKSGSYEAEIPIIVEIESKDVLFDMNLNPVERDRTVLKGESKTIEVRLFNLQSIESYNVNMDYYVKDMNGNTIISEKEDVVVKTQASFFKTLKTPKSLKSGNYVFIAEASFGDSVGTASYLFEVKGLQDESKTSNFAVFCRNDPLCWSLSIIVLLLIFAIGAYLYFFIGAYIYWRLLGSGIAQGGRVEKPAAERPVVKKERRSIFQAFRHWRGRKLIEKGYNALGRGKIKKAGRLYKKLIYAYEHLPTGEKARVFKEINSFYKSLLAKRRQLELKMKKEKADEEQRQLEELVGKNAPGKN